MGAYHTLDLELNRKFSITKAEWDSIALERVEMACDVAQSADVAAVSFKYLLFLIGFKVMLP